MRDEYLPFGKPNFSDEEIAAVTRVLRSGWVGMGPETLEFEGELGAFVGAPHVVTANSCTSALFLSLLAHGVGPGDEVICPSLTWCSTANAAMHLGARPVFCDIDPDTLCASAETIEAKLSPRTKAVVIVHLGGLAIEPGPIRDALPAHVALVEDAAHALGARYADGRPVGSSGNLTCFSFYANKNLSTGEGGAVALSDEETAARLRSSGQNAMPSDAWKRYSHSKSLFSFALTDLGYKMNFTDLQAAIGRIQLRRQKEFRARRMKIAAHYRKNLQSMIPGLQFQHNLHDADHARHLYLIVLPRTGFLVSRDRLLLALRDRNIGASIHYPPLHRMPLYGGADQPALPVTESIAARILTLPISASMSLADADSVVVETEQALRAEERVVV